MAQLLMTGFPGFLGSALLPRLLARRPDTDAVCLVQPQHAVLARSRVKELEITDPHTMGRIRLTEGDITVPGLGLGAAERERLDDVREVWHLAAVYDLAVAPQIARRVNVDGTTNVLDFCREQPAPAPPAVRQHLLRQRPLRGRVRRGRPRGGPGVPQPLRGDQVRGRADRAQGDGRRHPGHHLPPGHRRRRLADRRHPEVRRPLLPRHLPRAPGLARRGAGRGGCRPRAGLPRAARLRGGRDGRAVGARRLRRAHLRPRRPRPPDRARGRHDLRPAPQHQGRVDAVAAGSGARHRRARPRHGAAARPARGGSRLLRLTHHLRDGEHDARPHGIRPGLPAVPRAMPGSCSTSCRPTPSTTPTR